MAAWASPARARPRRRARRWKTILASASAPLSVNKRPEACDLVTRCAWSGRRNGRARPRYSGPTPSEASAEATNGSDASDAAPGHARWLRAAAFAIAFATALASHAARAASVAPVAAENGMVVTAQHLASEVGVDVLKRGGNAVDAAVAVGYALAVVYPAAGNLGGGGFMTLQLADGRKTSFDFREKAPLAASASMYLDRCRQRRSAARPRPAISPSPFRAPWPGSSSRSRATAR